MPIKVYKKNDAGRRQMSVVDRSSLSKVKPEKRLLRPKKQNSGRNNSGSITVRHRGGGEGKQYRMIDFSQTEKLGMTGKVKTLEYDPNRTVWIGLTVYPDGDKRYHIMADGVKQGDTVTCADKVKIAAGNRCRIKNIPAGFQIFNIEMTPGKGGIVARSAGSSARLVSLDNDKHAQIQMPSSEVRLFDKECFATIGVAANIDHSNQIIGKAGRVRRMGRRPQVRGKVMNPVDHPHGGGEQRNSIGMKAPKTPWGALALGVKTRSPKKSSSKFIVSRRKPGRFSQRRK